MDARNCLDPHLVNEGLDDGDLAGCACREAVGRSFSLMMTSGASQKAALDVATRVYRHHHPEINGAMAREMVEIWVHQGPIH